MNKFNYESYLLVTGINIGIERKRKNLKQKYLCEGICSIKTLCSMEKGKYIVKENTYKRILERLSYISDFKETLYTEIFSLYESFYNLKEFGISTNNNNLKASINNFDAHDDLTLNYFKQLLLLFFNPIKKSNLDNHIFDFINQCYKYFPAQIQDLCLNFLYIYYSNLGDYLKVDEIIHLSEFINRKFSANVLFYLDHLANSKNYLTLLNIFEKYENDWLIEKNYFTLLMGYEVILIPVLRTNPSKLSVYIDKCEEFFQKIINQQIDISKNYYSNYNYNIGLVYTYSKDYEKAYPYLEKSVISDVDKKNLINQVLLEYVCNRLSSDKNFSTTNEFYLYTGNHKFKNEYNYFFYKKNSLKSFVQLQAYIVDEILPNNMDGSDILYQVFLYEMIQLCNITKAYSYLKIYIETVNR